MTRREFDMKVTSAWKGVIPTKLWIVHLPDGTTRGFKAHEYTKEQALNVVLKETKNEK